MRRALSVLLVLTLVLGAAWTARAEDPQSLDELTRALDRAAERLTEVAQLAARDPRYREVKAFLAKTQEEFKRKRSPKAEDMIEIVVDAKAPGDLRTAARDALLEPRVRMYSPYLLERKGSTKPRNRWATSRVVKHLGADDQTTRELLHDLLLKLFPRASRNPDLGTYNPKSSKSRQHREVMAAWKDFLRK